jgi:hypothetical protein
MNGNEKEFGKFIYELHQTEKIEILKDNQTYVIGREGDIQIDSISISKRHAQIGKLTYNN